MMRNALVQTFLQFDRATSDKGNLRDICEPKLRASAHHFLEFYRQCRSPSERKDPALLPWTDVYKPVCPDNFVNNQNVASAVQQWMLAWKARLAKSVNCEVPSVCGKSRRIYDDYDYIDRRENDDLFNALLLYGPTGAGKTEIIHAMAKLCGLKVIEISTSTNRGQKSLEWALSEAAESYRMSWSEETASVQLKAPRETRKRKREDIRKFFASASAAASLKSHAPAVEAEIVSPTETASSLILFDDADIILQTDNGFHVLLRKLIAKSRAPIAITCSDAELLDRALESLNVIPLEVQSPSVEDLLIHCKLILLANELLAKDEQVLNDLVRQSNRDWRKCLLNLQFAVESYRPTTCASNTFGNDHFELQNSPVEMNESVDSTCERSLSSQEFVLLQHYPQLETLASRHSIITDYLPYARQMALIDSQRYAKAAEDRKIRQLSYFRKICIDDKEGSLSKELARHPFQTHSRVY